MFISHFSNWERNEVFGWVTKGLNNFVGRAQWGVMLKVFSYYNNGKVEGQYLTLKMYQCRTHPWGMVEDLIFFSTLNSWAFR